MDTNWCMVCGTHIDCPEDVTYCSEICRHSDCGGHGGSSSNSSGSGVGLMPPSPSAEYFALGSPASSSPASSPRWGPQTMFRERSSSLTPMSAQDLAARYPCHKPAYSSSRSSLVLLHQSPSLGPSAMDIRGRGTSLPSVHQLSAM
ncbi:hypothetical protein GGF46_000084 [Coemansia sp. RSA 552]|nr:hypothetical protein GGF46_000084 [Coemansia sp. RSA 552]